ncbi:endogenous retrovirus group K member 11 Pol protein [Pangshura tecta]
MGALQPGLPTPTMLPHGWPLLVIDLKDCFFTIHLHPADREKFAFSVPSVNKAGPAKRYQWTVLPQGMKNSPTICQFYVAWAIAPLRIAHPDWIIYHYMDDLLFTSATFLMEAAIAEIDSVLQKAGLVLAPEKIQQRAPYRYLGMEITDSIVRPQNLTLRMDVQNLHDVQRLVGDLQWVRGLCGITNEDLAPLIRLLKGGRAPNEPRSLQPEHRAALQAIATKLATCYSGRIYPDLPIFLAIFSKDASLEALLFQWHEALPDPLVGIEWLFPPSHYATTVTTRLDAIAHLVQVARHRLLAIAGTDPHTIYLPFTDVTVTQLLTTHLPFVLATLNYTGQFSSHFPSHRLFTTVLPFEKVLMLQSNPVDGLTVFTDASGAAQRAGLLWFADEHWHHELVLADGSLQVLELRAIVRAFEKWPDTPLNIVSDSLYAVGLLRRLERSFLGHVPNPVLWSALLHLWHILDARQCPYFVMHIRSHSGLQDGLAEGNALIDHLVGAAHIPDSFAQARVSHEFFHQSARALARQFSLSLTDARAIVASCPDCQQHVLPLMAGVNPRGLASLQVWQSDVTLFPEFGALRHVHVTIDTFSGFLWATALASTGSRDVIKHWQACFAVMGVPALIKTDNGAGYVSRRTAQFLLHWGVQHSTGVPGNSTGQAIIERAHASLKVFLLKQKSGMCSDKADTMDKTPAARLLKALYVLNWLHLGKDSQVPPAVKHVGGITGEEQSTTPRPLVQWFDYQQQKWKGPVDLLTWGRGYACVATDTGPRWIPAKWVRPWLRPRVQQQADTEESRETHPGDAEPESLEDDCPLATPGLLTVLFGSD